MDNTPQSPGPKETDQLVYKSNQVPRALRLVWTLFFLFSIFYMMQFAWPDLREWIQKLKAH